MPPEPAPTPTPDVNTTSFDTSGVLTVWVPYDAELLEDTRTVTLTAGKVKAVAFGFNTTAAEQVASR